MTTPILFVLAMLAAALVAFALEWLSVDVIALLVVVSLVLGGALTPDQAFAGFASEVIIVLASLFVLSGALVRTGVMEWAAQAIQRLGKHSESRIIGYLMPLCGGLSAFLSNTSTTAMLMPAVVEYAKRAKISPSRLLMPLAYASMLGGSATLMGTSTNLATSGLIVKLGMEPVTLFEFLPVGIAMMLVGTAYMMFAGRYLLPSHTPTSFVEEYEITRYLSEIMVREDSSLSQRTLADAALSERGVHVMAIVRNDARVVPLPTTRLEANDVLIVQASRDSLLELDEDPGLSFEATGKISDEELAADGKVVEAIVMPGSWLVARTLKGLRFRERFGVSVLAIHRRGTSHPTEISSLPLAVGDVLLLQGSEEQLGLLQGSHRIRLLGEVVHTPFRRRAGTIVLSATLTAVALAASGVLPLSIAFLLAALIAVLARCVTAEEAYRLIEWRLIILIGGMTSLGVAMTETGAAELVASWVAQATAPFGPYAVMTAFIVLTMLLTQALSNAAAALVVVPVAVSTALQVGMEPRTLAVVVALSASLSFITPLEPACLLVYSPGKYRFMDFVRVGLPLSLLALLVLLGLVPVFWPM